MIHRRLLAVLAGNIGTGKMKILLYHVESRMAEYFLQHVYVASIQRVNHQVGRMVRMKYRKR
ncbi:MAG: hypothetical protein ABSG90_14185 [Dehalococcoidia bacterium]|jgi:hypothetical protein